MIRQVQLPLQLVDDKASLYTGYTVGCSTKHVQYNGPPEKFGPETLPQKSPSNEQERNLDFTYFHTIFSLKAGRIPSEPNQNFKIFVRTRFNSSGTIRKVLGTYLLMEIDTAIVKNS